MNGTTSLKFLFSTRVYGVHTSRLVTCTRHTQHSICLRISLIKGHEVVFLCVKRKHLQFCRYEG
jgi:hypothetical protein